MKQFKKKKKKTLNDNNLAINSEKGTSVTGVKNEPF